MCRVSSLRQLAAEAVPRNIILVNLPHDIVTIIKHNKLKAITCGHGTIWNYRRGKINGMITYACECAEEWHNDKYVRDIVICVEHGHSARGCECRGVWGCEWECVEIYV